MNQKQQPRMTHKVVLHATQRQRHTLATGMKQLPTLAKGILKKIIE